jgi:TonB family protein
MSPDNHPSDNKHVSKLGLPWKSVGAGAVTALIAVGAFQLLTPGADSHEGPVTPLDPIIEQVETVTRHTKQTNTPTQQAPPPALTQTRQVDSVPTPRVSAPSPRQSREIQRKLNETVQSYSACYQAGLATDPSIEGTVTVQFRVEEDGSVSSARVTKSDLGSQMAEDCLCQVIRLWRFKEGYASDDFQLDFPFAQE